MFLTQRLGWRCLDGDILKAMPDSSAIRSGFDFKPAMDGREWDREKWGRLGIWQEAYG
jgi:hypothetical protein